MSYRPPPPVDDRGFEELRARAEELVVARVGPVLAELEASDDPVEALLGRFAGEEDPAAAAARRLARTVPGGVLLAVFARLSEIVVERLNAVPDKAYLAFLDLIGVRLSPPQPARVPLTFALAAGRTAGTHVPAGTAAAAQPTPDDPGPVVFETERDLRLAPWTLGSLIVHDPRRDRYADRGNLLRGDDAAVPALEAETPIEHALYVAHDSLSIEEPKSATVVIDSPDAAGLAALPVEWSYRDGEGWSTVTATTSLSKEQASLVVWFESLPRVAPVTVAGRAAPWLRARLGAPFPPSDLREDEVGAGATRVRRRGVAVDRRSDGATVVGAGTPFAPFGRAREAVALHLSVDEAFVRAGGDVTLHVALDEPGLRSPALALRWSYWDGTAWKRLGRSSAADGSLGDEPRFLDDTLALTREGTVTMRVPADWRSVKVGGVVARWLRVDVEGDYGGARERPGRPRIAAMHVDYDATIPRIDAVRVGVRVVESALRPDHVLQNEAPVDPTKPFAPFGDEPTFGDTLAVASAPTLSKLGNRVEIDFAVANPVRPSPFAAPVPLVRPSSDVLVTWEAWDGRNWVRLGDGALLPGWDLLAAYTSRAVTGEPRTIGGSLSAGTAVEITTPHAPSGAKRVSAPDTSTPGRYSATLPNDRVGGYGHLLTFKRGDATVARIWAPMTVVAPGGEAPALELEQTAALTAETSFTIRGTTAAGGEVVVHHAAREKPILVTPDAEGAFEADFKLGRGRNDVLVLAQDAAGTSVAADVVTVVYDPAALHFGDATFAFTRSGRVRLEVPPAIGRPVVGATEAHWIRARLARGNYGLPARYAETREDADDKETREDADDQNNGGDKPPAYRVIPATFAPPSVSDLTIDYRYEPDPAAATCATDNDFVLGLVSDEAPASFRPFTPSAERDPALCLGFEGPVENAPATLFVRVDPPRYEPSPARADGESLEPPQTVWEYARETGWERLGARDETRALTRRGLVTFVVPADLKPTERFGRRARWVRVRLAEGRHASAPRVRGVLTNTTWASHAASVGDEVIGSSTGEPGQRLRSSQAPVLPGERLEVREPVAGAPPRTAGLEAAARTPGPSAAPAGTQTAGAASPAEGEWIPWQPVRDFYASGPEDRHYMLDRATGEVRFGDGRTGRVPPPGRGNVRLARYRTGGGLFGNRAAGQITELKTAVPYVDSVTNAEPASGGSAAGSLAEARERGPRMLRHGDRAVAQADYEDLAFEASPAVARARAVPPADASEAGRVELIVLPDSPEARPAPSLELLAQVDDHLRPRLPATAELVVRGPDWVEVAVEAEVVPRLLEEGIQVMHEVEARIAEFLHPVTGGPAGQGWPFGRGPHRSDMFGLIESSPGVDHARRVKLHELPGPHEERPTLWLVHSGRHRVTVTGGDDG